MKEDKIFIEPILESINAIEDFSKNISKEELVSNRLKQSAIVREIEIIGEAAKNLSEEFRNKYDNINWKEIIRARDKIVHHYFGVDLEIIWSVIKIDIPNLKIKILKIRNEINS